MIAPADENLADGRLVLKVALEAEGGVALAEEFFVHRAVRFVADEAAFARCFVLVNERPALLRVATVTGLIVTHEGRAACDNRMALVRVMAIAAGHFVVQHGMRVGQVELASLVEVAIEADFGGTIRIDDGMARAAGLVVDAAGAVTGFAAHVHRVWTAHLEFGVSRSRKIARDVFVTFRARLRAYELGALNLWWRHDGAGDGRAGDENYGDKAGTDQGGEPPVAAKPRTCPLRGRRAVHHKGPF